MIRTGSSSLLIALLLTSLGAAEVPAPQATAQEVIGGALDEIIQILNESGLPEDSRRDRIAEIAYERFDFDTMAKLVVSRPWRKFTKVERAEFIAEFKVLLARSYGRRLSRYEGVQVKVVGEAPEQGGDITVRSQVVGGQFDGASMNYRMRSKTGEWLVIDVHIEGVGLVSNFRSQFKPILARGGAKELLGRIKDKNDVLRTDPDGKES